jgi:hypothetical protein
MSKKIKISMSGEVTFDSGDGQPVTLVDPTAEIGHTISNETAGAVEIGVLLQTAAGAKIGKVYTFTQEDLTDFFNDFNKAAVKLLNKQTEFPEFGNSWSEEDA